MFVVGDTVKITLYGSDENSDNTIEGTVLQVKPKTPHMPEDCVQTPGPIFKVKILKFGGGVWDSWIDGRDKIEIL